MTIVASPEALTTEDLYVDLGPVLEHPLLLKVEGLNLAGSIKLKAAREMVDAAERSGRLRPGAVLVESSSGNLGVALSMIAAARGYGFVCVTDSRCTTGARSAMKAMGAEVHVVTRPAPGRGLLGARLDHVRSLCASDDRYVCLDQYANTANWRAHYRHTAPAIGRAFPGLDVLFVGAGTTGTLMGCARYFRTWQRRTRVVAVDVLGSVAFGGAPAPRQVPGLGTSVRPSILDETWVDEVVRVDEADGVRTCRDLAGHGYLFGGSTGAVVHAAQAWLSRPRARGLLAVAISPDLGERYLDTVYNPAWVEQGYDADPVPESA